MLKRLAALFLALVSLLVTLSACKIQITLSEDGELSLSEVDLGNGGEDADEEE